jgi:hypothetical protein
MSRKRVALGLVFAVVALSWLALGWPLGSSQLASTEAPSAPPAALRPMAASPTPQPLIPVRSVTAPQKPLAKPAELRPAVAPPLPAAAPEEQPPILTAEYGTRESDELIRTDQGRSTSTASQYRTEPRDYDAGRTEAWLRESFSKAPGASDLLRAVSCRETICKVDLRWSMKRMHPYLDGIMRSQNFVEHSIAVSPVGSSDSFGVRPLELYLKRKPPSETSAPDPALQPADHGR